jgi:hypothetical protein
MTSRNVTLSLAVNVLCPIALLGIIKLLWTTSLDGDLRYYGQVLFFAVWPIIGLLVSFSAERRYLQTLDAPSSAVAGLITAIVSLPIVPSLSLYVFLDPSNLPHILGIMTGLAPGVIVGSLVLTLACFIFGMLASRLRAAPAVAYYLTVGTLSSAAWLGGLYLFLQGLARGGA